MTTSTQLDRWKCVVRTILGRNAVKHTATIRANVLAVDAGIKPAYLFDCFSVTQPRTLCTLISRLRTESLIHSKLFVLDVESTFFLCNGSALRFLLADDKRGCSQQIVIDVSVGLDEPVLLGADDARSALLNCVDAVRTALERTLPQDDTSCTGSASEIGTPNAAHREDPSKATVRENQNSSKNCDEIDQQAAVAHGLTCFSVNFNDVDEVLTADVTPNLNRTTLFGLLLGYPVLYWYRCIDPTVADNCLSFAPLVVTKVFLYEESDPTSGNVEDAKRASNLNTAAAAITQPHKENNCCNDPTAESKCAHSATAELHQLRSCCALHGSEHDSPTRSCFGSPQMDSGTGTPRNSKHARTMTSSRPMLLYSFSYPECLRVECGKAAEAWKAELASEVARLNGAWSIEFEVEMVSLSVVAM